MRPILVKTSSCVCVLLCIMLLGTSGVLAQQTTLIHLIPAPALVGEGQTAAVEVRVENVRDLYGLDIRLSFDPSVVEVVDADPTTDGVQVRPGDLLSVDFVIRNTADNEKGTIWFALTQLNPSEAVNGSGTAYIITFKGKRAVASSPLTITYQKMATRTGETIPASTTDSEIRVVEAAQAPPTPTEAPPPPQPTVGVPTQAPAASPTSILTEAPTTAAPAEETTSPAPTDTPLPTQTTAPTEPPPTPTPARTAVPAPTATPVIVAEVSQPSPTRAAPSPTPISEPPPATGGPSTSFLLEVAVLVLVLAIIVWVVRRKAKQST
ncbi:MAG: hypothetical protein H5T64_12855 [Chloroflexi bacterium]|nr:hypothetical protein [Chloroflexota bacterium]